MDLIFDNIESVTGRSNKRIRTPNWQFKTHDDTAVPDESAQTEQYRKYYNFPTTEWVLELLADYSPESILNPEPRRVVQRMREVETA
jgi:hypothetical protein